MYKPVQVTCDGQAVPSCPADVSLSTYPARCSGPSSTRRSERRRAVAHGPVSWWTRGFFVRRFARNGRHLRSLAASPGHMAEMAAAWRLCGQERQE